MAPEPRQAAATWHLTLKCALDKLSGTPEMKHMTITFTDRVALPKDVMISDIGGESVLLNMNSERYFGLDKVGTRMLSVLTESSSIQKAYEVLLDEYDVDAELLRRDLVSLIDKLLAQGLMEFAGE
jgi:hypothetical protein